MQKPIAFKIGRLLRAARKMNNISQVEACHSLQLTQGTLSKIENGVLIPKTDLWFEFCDFYKLDVNAYYFGVVDNFKTIKTSDISRVGLFSIPQEWGEVSTVGVRGISPYRKLFVEELSEKEFEDFCDLKKMDSDYFRIFDNAINYRFEFELVEFLIDKRILGSKKLKKLIDAVLDPNCHGVSSRCFKNLGPKQSLEHFIDIFDRYNSGFKMSVIGESKDKIEIKIDPIEELSTFDFTKLKNFYFNFFQTILESTPKLADKNYRYSSDFLEKKFFNKNPECIIRVEYSA
ncbi:MAG: helix-turn-helix transcriptional regulator [Halobacteriovoraceae bacterium]|nr:helix-turn-helix transcriptional regulator [Halobacteriovoraceae bacterium]MCB9095835.1 helix-turn-helix transcriptional regulator [Halobacteriovoraceae bacterium]